MRASCVIAAFVWSCLLGSVMAADETEWKGVGAYREKYDVEMEKIHAEYAKTFEGWPNEYLAALDSLEKTLQQTGNLKGLLAVRNEAERFRKQKTLDEVSLVKEPAELRELQTRMSGTPKAMRLARDRKIVLYSSRYVGAMESLQKRLTIKGQVDAAIEVQAEIDRIESAREVQEAKKALAASGESVIFAGEGGEESLGQGLVLYYSFDSAPPEGGAVADEGVGTRNGTSSNVAYSAQGKRNGGFAFNGKNSYVDCGTLAGVSMERGFSLVLWVNHRSVNSQFIASKHMAERGATFEMGTDEKNTPQAAFYVGGQREFSRGREPMEKGKWYFLAATFDGREQKLYVNARLDATAARVGKLDASASQFRIGWGYTDSGTWDGLIDEVLIYDRALTEKEIASLYRIGGGSVSETVKPAKTPNPPKLTNPKKPKPTLAGPGEL